jgi:hypothetical protein
MKSVGTGSIPYIDQNDGKHQKIPIHHLFPKDRTIRRCESQLSENDLGDMGKIGVFVFTFLS